MRYQPTPIDEPFLIGNKISPVWVRWFSTVLDRLADQTEGGDFNYFGEIPIIVPPVVSRELDVYYEIPQQDVYRRVNDLENFVFALVEGSQGHVQKKLYDIDVLIHDTINQAGIEDTRYKVVTHTTDTNLTLSDMRKIHTMDVSGGDRQFTLPSVDSSSVGDWVIIVRIGTANTLYIYAADTDTILDSSAGGSIECNDATYDLSTFSPILFAATRWGAGPSCFGIWETR